MGQCNIKHIVSSIIVLLTVFQLSAQCWFSDLNSNFDDFSVEYQRLLKTAPDAYMAYKILYEDGSVILKDGFSDVKYITDYITDLNTDIPKVVTEIQKAGGYKNWRKLDGTDGGVVGTLDDLLANSKFKSIYDPLADGRHVSLLKNNLTAAEEAAMKLFVQDNYYQNFNKALAGDIPMTPEYVVMKDLMEVAHAKLPKEIKSLLFRGAGKIESAFAKTLKIGDEFDFGGRFTSSADDIGEANLFRRGGKGDVIWEIESKTGVDITKINSSEAEFLFKPYTKYRLNKIEPLKSNPEILIYKIIEL